ncbi:MAG: hypothetical protein V4757_19010 [Pseudomonadota bacterium]
MHTRASLQPTLHPDYDAIMAAARARANQLRDEAMDDAWQGARDASSRGMRTVTRLAHALARHARLRQRAGA